MLIAANDGAELRDIDVRVLDLGGVEGPFHEVEAAGECIVALSEFECAGDAAIAKFWDDADHVRVEVRVAIAEGWQCHREAYGGRFLTQECAHDLPADAGG